MGSSLKVSNCKVKHSKTTHTHINNTGNLNYKSINVTTLYVVVKNQINKWIVCFSKQRKSREKPLEKPYTDKNHNHKYKKRAKQLANQKPRYPNFPAATW